MSTIKKQAPTIENRKRLEDYESVHLYLGFVVEKLQMEGRLKKVRKRKKRLYFNENLLDRTGRLFVEFLFKDDDHLRLGRLGIDNIKESRGDS